MTMYGVPEGSFILRDRSSKGRLCEVVEVVAQEGKGTDDDPVRPVIYYLTRDGRVLARQDDWEQEEYHKSRKWGKNFEEGRKGE